MQTVRVVAQVRDTAPEVVFDRITAFERYPELVDTVRQVTVRRDDALRPESDWEVLFRHGLLCWTEVDTLDRAGLRVDFDQLEGDFDVFRGVWQLAAADGGTSVRFDADFDFGVPSLETIIDPVAVRVLTETIQRTVAGLFPGKVDLGVATSSLDRDWVA